MQRWQTQSANRLMCDKLVSGCSSFTHSTELLQTKV